MIDELSEDDLTALELAVEISRRNQEWNREFVDLERRYGWIEAAEIAAYDCQCRVLKAKPWQEPLCRANPGEQTQAGHLLQRMLACGISRFRRSPRPLVWRIEALRPHDEAVAAAPIAPPNRNLNGFRRHSHYATQRPGRRGDYRRQEPPISRVRG